MSHQPEVRVDSEWAPLRECVYGSAAQHIFGLFLQDAKVRANGSMIDRWKAYEGRSLADVEPETYALWRAEIEGVVDFLRRSGVVVHQPTLLSGKNLLFPRGENHGIAIGWMRDPFTTIGGNVIELAPRSLLHRRQRFAIRHILFGTMERGARYFAQPDGGAEDNIEDLAGFGYLEGGDIFVLGKTILVGHSGNASNSDGARWLQHALGPDYTVSLVDIDARASHLDLFLMTPREGVAVACLEAFPHGLPSAIKDWDIIDIPFEIAKLHCGVNHLVLDDRTVLLPASEAHDRLAQALEQRGFETPRLPYETVVSFGGSLRCAYQPLARY
jgi:N-dimethylarginine dimethylaminohydrolase